MYNVHTPERQPGESFEQYKQRRKVSQILLKRNLRTNQDIKSSRERKRHGNNHSQVE